MFIEGEEKALSAAYPLLPEKKKARCQTLPYPGGKKAFSIHGGKKEREGEAGRKV